MAVYYLIQIMLYTGMRPAEAFALTRSDIDLDENTITINKAAHSTITSKLEVSTTKTVRSARVVPVPDQLRDILAECLAWSKYDVLLTRHNGELLDIDWIATLIGNVRRKCGVYFHLYMLRHLYASDLLSSGTPVHILRDLMGHESGSMSVDYAISSPDERKRAVNERKIGNK